VLEHFNFNIKPTLLKLKSWLKDDGYLIIATPDKIRFNENLPDIVLHETVGAYMPEIETLSYGGFNVNSSQQFFKICQYLVQNYEQIDRKRLLEIAQENTYIQRVEQLKTWMN